MSDSNTKSTQARLDQLSMTELKAIHLAIFGEQVHRAQRRALVSRLRQAIGLSAPEGDTHGNADSSDASTVSSGAASSGTASSGAAATDGDTRVGDSDGGEDGVDRGDSGDGSRGEADRASTNDTGDAEPVDATTPSSPQPNPAPLKYLRIAELQLRIQQLTGAPTRSRNRTYLMRAIRQQERDAHMAPSPTTKPSWTNVGFRTVSVRVPIPALDQIDLLCERLCITSRSAFLRQSMYRYLCELGEPKAASLIAPSL